MVGRILVAGLVGLVGALGSTTAAAVAPADGATRILIVGDSITQGSVGDYTWRYFLWKHLQAAGTEVDFVGPNQGLYGLQDGDVTNPDYADAEFDQDHASQWGLSVTYLDCGCWGNPTWTHSATELAENYDPDVVITDLGTNDLTFLAQSPDQLLDEQDAFIEEIREVRPDTKFVSYNQALPGWAASVSTTKRSIEGRFWASFSRSGTKVRSVNSMRSSA